MKNVTLDDIIQHVFKEHTHGNNILCKGLLFHRFMLEFTQND